MKAHSSCLPNPVAKLPDMTELTLSAPSATNAAARRRRASCFGAGLIAVLASACGGTAPDIDQTGGDALLVKLDEDGEVLFRNVIDSDGGFDCGADVATIAGDTIALLNLDERTTIVCYDTAGEQLWSTPLAGKDKSRP